MNNSKDLRIFSEFTKCMRHIFKMTHPKFEEIGLYPGQPQLLKTLLKDNKKNQRELAKELMIKPSTLTVMVQRMEKQGFIKKEQDKEDLRKSVINITDKGIEILKRFEEVENEFENEFNIILSNDEKYTLMDLIHKINNQFGNTLYEHSLKGDD